MPTIATPAVGLRAVLARRDRHDLDSGDRADGRFRLNLGPWLSHHLGTSEPLGLALLILYNVGLVWILVLTLLLVRRARRTRSGCALRRIRRANAWVVNGAIFTAYTLPSFAMIGIFLPLVLK